MPLNELKIRNAKPKDKRYQISDSEGLYLEVMVSGKKYWRLRYTKDGKKNWHTLGMYPDVSLQQAREARNDLKKKLRSNSPLLSSSADTFGGIAAEWVAAHEVQLSSDKYMTSIRTRLSSHVLPFIGDRKIAELKPADILSVINRLTAMHSFEMAKRARSMCSQIFRFAIATGRCEFDPTAALRGAIISPPVKHHPAITNPAEIAALLAAIDSYPFTIVRNAMRFSILTFVRPGEARKAEWEEIQDDEWRIPKGKMKMRKLHIVPLARQTLELLRKMRELTGHGRYVFPSARAPHGDRPMSDSTVLVALRAMGYTKDQLSPHGFRSMASTLLNEHGFNKDWIERQLSHGERNSVRAAYNYAEYLPDRRNMMQWWADYIDRLRNSN
jgi:integrase